jgi:hypothetical protein
MISTIDRLPQSDSDYLARSIMEAKVLSAHQQLGASVDTLTFRDEMDDENGASFRFWIGDEYTSIQRAFLRFRVQALRSTVKSVGGTSASTEAGGGGTSAAGGGGTSASGGSSAPSSEDGYWYNAYTGNDEPPEEGHHVHYVGSTNHTHDVNISAHTHDIDNHAHSIDSHTHELTAAVSMSYGIFEESGANTLALSDLVIGLNGGADMLASVVDIGNGWFELDFTDALTDAAFRPLQENNEITFTTITNNKTARIEAQITIRGVVQAINYG